MRSPAGIPRMTPVPFTVLALRYGAGRPRDLACGVSGGASPERIRWWLVPSPDPGEDDDDEDDQDEGGKRDPDSGSIDPDDDDGFDEEEDEDDEGDTLWAAVCPLGGRFDPRSGTG